MCPVEVWLEEGTGGDCGPWITQRVGHSGRVPFREKSRGPFRNPAGSPPHEEPRPPGCRRRPCKPGRTGAQRAPPERRRSPRTGGRGVRNDGFVARYHYPSRPEPLPTTLKRTPEPAAALFKGYRTHNHTRRRPCLTPAAFGE